MMVQSKNLKEFVIAPVDDEDEGKESLDEHQWELAKHATN